LNGGQGSGKSTLAALVAAHLRRAHGLRVLVLSLDDLYLDKAARHALAASVHPLFATRGVPGTHDVSLGLTLLARLRAGIDPDHPLPLPAFDKAIDDRVPEALAPRLAGEVDLVLFEGWCVGATPQADADLRVPVNGLEAEEDTDGRWRRQVNAALRGPYAELFAVLDALVMLRVPDFDAVHRWREAQEAQLRRAGRGGMSPADVTRFVAHYERLTRHMLRTLPARADLILDLDATHAIGGVRSGGASTGGE
jgi:D-glycerate 3-kinase